MQDQIKKIKDWVRSLYKNDISYDKEGIRPTRDWQVILVSSFLIILILGGIAFYFYYEVSKSNLFVINEDFSSDQVKINRQSLDKIINDIKNRKDQFGSIKNEEVVPLDPSI